MDEQTKQENRHIILVVCFIWFVAVLAFLVYAASQKLVAFDPDGKLWQQSQEQNFDQSFSTAMISVFGDVQSKVIHFSQSGCKCNLVAQEHIQSVKSLASEHGYANQQLLAEDSQLVAKYFPATPAIAVFDDKGKLSYLGPYSAGYSCTVGNGIVESYISRAVKTAPGATIVSSTEGCYCPT